MFKSSLLTYLCLLVFSIKKSSAAILNKITIMEISVIKRIILLRHSVLIKINLQIITNI